VRPVTTILLPAVRGKLRALQISGCNLLAEIARHFLTFSKHSSGEDETGIRIEMRPCKAARSSSKGGPKTRLAAFVGLTPRCAGYPESATSAGYSEGLRFLHGVLVALSAVPFVYRAAYRASCRSGHPVGSSAQCLLEFEATNRLNQHSLMFLSSILEVSQ